MNTTRFCDKVNHCMTLVAALILAFSIHPIFALDDPLDVASARLSLQRNYAFMIGLQIRDVVCAASATDVDSFANQHLLNGGNDPFIQGPIDYTPKQYFSFTMNGSVEEPLQGTKMVYHYCPKTAQWVFDPNSTAATTQSGLPELGMAIMTDYCLRPNEADQKLCDFWDQCVPFDSEVPLCRTFGSSEEAQNEATDNREALDTCFPEMEPNPDVKMIYLEDCPRPVTVQDLEACPHPVYSMQIGELKIPRLALQHNPGEMKIFQAILRLSNSDEPPRFRLCAFAEMGIEKQSQKGDTTFDGTRGIVSIPNVVDSNARTYMLELKAIEGFEFGWDNEKVTMGRETGREIAQNNYVLSMVKKIRKAIDYTIRNHDSELEEITNFVQGLLVNDPFVKDIRYELPTPEKEFITITISMQNTEFVDPQLRDKEKLYQYYHGGGPIFDEYGRSTATDVDFMQPDIGKDLTRNYCQDNPQGNTPDSEWCPVWLQLVM